MILEVSWLVYEARILTFVAGRDRKIHCNALSFSHALIFLWRSHRVWVSASHIAYMMTGNRARHRSSVRISS